MKIITIIRAILAFLSIFKPKSNRQKAHREWEKYRENIDETKAVAKKISEALRIGNRKRHRKLERVRQKLLSKRASILCRYNEYLKR